ncbi:MULTISPECIES: flagellar biosynthetic protein FliO [Serratia]|uniref:flagellar biosynthetic protein FliO n=1 Tax=Serratia TaxID=613 RepID=UPI0005CAB29F|nr:MULTISPECIES: flagellar biosynthetic protein FliO [Serratia]MBB1584085.1 flagellar biosynthetic protein FliO [Serratia sp. OS31]NLU16724.1 flagellar biosynthetic protein FliO [Serratia liquefaciens]WBL73473.1 flagellar biosynthetic protein FliO [Serratia liquefaciens]CAI2516930.1 Flagellar protein fliO [Serratia liquefaciens]GAK27322.1 flagellar biosynthetic protein [Serratia liquefaciens FK01]
MNPSAAAPTVGTLQSTEPALPAGSVLTQVSSALGGILLLILLAGWLFRRLGFAPQARNSKLLNLRASCQVGQRERVVVIEVDNTLLVLGVTAQQITPLHSLPAPAQDTDAAAVTTPADFRQLMQKVLKRPEKSA